MSTVSSEPLPPAAAPADVELQLTDAKAEAANTVDVVSPTKSEYPPETPLSPLPLLPPAEPVTPVVAAHSTPQPRKKRRPPVALLICVLIIAMSQLMVGYSITAINAPEGAIRINCNTTLYEGQYFKPCIPVNSTEWSVIVSIMFIGGMLSSMLAGKLSDFLGRKLSLILSNVPFFIGFTMISFANNGWLLGIGRFFIGAGAGMASVIAPMYSVEISHASVRGFMGGISSVLMSLGGLIAMLVSVGLAQRDNHKWRYIFVIPIGLLLLQSILVLFIPESPRLLIFKGKEKQARRALQRIRAKQNVDQELNVIIKGVEMVKEKSKLGLRKLICNLHFVKNLVVAVGLQLLQQCTGLIIMMSFSTDIFTQVGFPLPLLANVIIGVVNLGMGVISNFFVDCVGRKVMMIGGLVIIIASHVLLSISSVLHSYGIATTAMGILSLIAICCFFVGFNIGAGPIPWTMTNELFTPDVKPYGVGIALATHFLSRFVLSVVFLPLKIALKGFIFFPLAGINVLSLIFVIVMVPETKKKSIEEISTTEESRSIELKAAETPA